MVLFLHQPLKDLEELKLDLIQTHQKVLHNILVIYA